MPLPARWLSSENQTPAAFRIFWHHGPGKDVITIIAITPHP